MKIDAPEIQALKAKVQAATTEFDFAMKMHEAWKPASYDNALHERIGRSYAANTFLVVRQALRREMLLSLMRLWDTDTKALRITAIANALGNRRIIDALAAASAARFNDWPGTKEAMSADLGASAGEAIALVRKYEENGERHGTFIKLKTLRDEHLAHRQLVPTPVDAGGYDAMDAEVEAFYQDMSSVIRLALHVVEKTAYNPREGAEVYAHYAEFFWASVRGERTEGHPQYVFKSSRPNPMAGISYLMTLKNAVEKTRGALSAPPKTGGKQISVRLDEDEFLVNHLDAIAELAGWHRSEVLYAVAYQGLFDLYNAAPSTIEPAVDKIMEKFKAKHAVELGT